jgi:hypothetical protein
MAVSKKVNLGPTKKVKPVVKRNIKSGLKEDFGYMKEGAKIAADVIIPRNASDLALTLAGGKLFNVGARAVSGITKKGAKFVSKTYKNIGK